MSTTESRPSRWYRCRDAKPYGIQLGIAKFTASPVPPPARSACAPRPPPSQPCSCAQPSQRWQLGYMCSDKHSWNLTDAEPVTEAAMVGERKCEDNLARTLAEAEYGDAVLRQDTWGDHRHLVDSVGSFPVVGECPNDQRFQLSHRRPWTGRNAPRQSLFHCRIAEQQSHPALRTTSSCFPGGGSLWPGVRCLHNA